MTYERLQAMIAAAADIDPATVSRQARLREELGLCSVDMMLLASALAAEYGDAAAQLTPSMTVEEILSVLGEENG
ncbi:MAG: hypothetical protein IJ168_02825 [Eubacterium sp.]|nr:hypothetical protein [Eubacterium sp.]